MQRNTEDGIDLILSVDEDVAQKLRSVFDSRAFLDLIAAMTASIENGGRIFFSGCGATGRLSILLNSMWRTFWQNLQGKFPEAATALDTADLANRTVSVMTGGDRALIRSVENFEDFDSFGRRQMLEHDISKKDTLLAISEGGETSSVIGTAWQGVDAGAKVFFIFNNPAELLREKIARSGDLISHPGVTPIDLCSGPMAVAGSTRMQATTAEQLLVGAALEKVIARLLGNVLNEKEKSAIGILDRSPAEYAAQFSELLEQLRSPHNLDILARACEREKVLYESGGRVTYFADSYILDILTDTTERAPTFMLPPFRACADKDSPVSWAFVKNPSLNTRDAWRHMLRREPRGLNWDSDLYRELGAPEHIRRNPPALDHEQVYSFQIGNEDDPSRYETAASLALAVLVGEEVEECLESRSEFHRSFARLALPFADRKILALGHHLPAGDKEPVWHLQYNRMPSPLSLWDHLALKLVLNTISTATMTLMGRVAGNWMICAEATNKKLIDRGTRLIQAFTGVDYLLACQTLHEVLADLAQRRRKTMAPLPPSVLAIRKLNPDANLNITGTERQ